MSGFCCGVSVKWGITGKDRPQTSLDETKLASTCDGFRASLNLEFAEDSTIMPFDRIQSKEESLANLAIGKSQGNELEYLPLTLTQWFGKEWGMWNW